MKNIELRSATSDDFQHILELNQNEVDWTSAMNLSRLEELHKLASYHKVAELNGKVVGFLLAIDSSANYINENFSWFLDVYSSFIYIDRIVIDKTCKNQGIGRMLYEDLLSFSRAQNTPMVACEFNLQPVNQASKEFHTKLGFKQVGERIYNNSAKLVSMQVRDTLHAN